MTRCRGVESKVLTWVVLSPSLIERLKIGRCDEVGVGVVQRREVLQDDGDDEVEEDKGAEDLEGDEEGHGRRAAAVAKVR